jgi:hypothetical protein
MRTEIIIQTANSVYGFVVRDYDTTVRGGIVGDRPVSCLPGYEITHAATEGDASRLVGKPLTFQVQDGGTYYHPNWEYVRTSAVVGAIVNAGKATPLAGLVNRAA